jgi:protein TonB
MRTRTFVVSFLVHALVIGAVVVTRVVATDVLPTPPRATTFILVTPEVPVMPSAPAPPRAAAAPQANPDAAPIAEPPNIQPEPILRVNDAPATADFVVGGGGDVPGAIVAGDPVPPPPARLPPPAAPVRIGGDIRPPEKVRHVAPEYPAIARSAGKSGIVILEAVIAEDGSVRDVSVLRSEPLLDEAAVRAVRQWRFTPTLLNGQPIAVIMTVTVAFNLQR